MTRRIIRAVVAFAAAVLSAPVAAASPASPTTWTQQTIPAVHDRIGSLSSVSCPSATFCAAVGTIYGTLNPTLAATWDGSQWTYQATAAGVVIPTLYGVSCSSPTFCVAVGYSDDGRSEPLVEQWDGRQWTVAPIAAPSTEGQLYGVSCVSSTDCTAVGGHANGLSTHPDYPYALHWDGHSWTRIVGLGIVGYADLLAVSCATSTSCTAVGNGGGGAIAVSRRAGGDWTPTTISGIVGPLTAVSCPTAATCTAVGTSSASPSTASVVHQVGSKWSVEATIGGGVTDLTGVSCTTSTQCFLVGSKLDTATSTRHVLVGQVTGTTVSVSSAAEPVIAVTAGLNGIACTSLTSCLAVGAFSTHNLRELSLSEQWRGTTWTPLRAPNQRVVLPAGLSDVSCPSIGVCTAVGRIDLPGGGGSVELAETLHGARWTPQPVPAVSPGELSSVSCSSATACLATGDVDGLQGLAYSWNGNHWTEVPVPQGTIFRSISCASSTSCLGVGFRRKGTTTVAAADAWDGSALRVVNLPSSFTPVGVSCPGPLSCVAEGGGQGGTWNGTSWALTPLPSGSGGDGGPALSCTSLTACVAANGTVADIWDGTTWRAQTLPSPSGVTQTQITAVSCATATACTAVGYTANASGVAAALAEVWNGTGWRLQRPVDVGSYAELEGVACTAPQTCQAVGAYGTVPNSGFPLAEMSAP